MDKLDELKYQVKLAFQLNIKNTHVVSSNDHMKQYTYIKFEDLCWLIEQAEKTKELIEELKCLQNKLEQH